MSLREFLRSLRCFARQAQAHDYRVVGVWNVDQAPIEVDVVDVEIDAYEPRVLLVLDSSGANPALTFADLRSKLHALLWKAHRFPVYLLAEEVQHANGWRSQELLEIEGIGLNPNDRAFGLIPAKGGFSSPEACD